MNEEKKKELIGRLLVEVPGWSNRKIARVFDCGVKLVADVRADMTASGELPKLGPEPDDVDEDL